MAETLFFLIGTKFIWDFGLILKLRDVEFARPFCFGKKLKKVNKIHIEISKI